MLEQIERGLSAEDPKLVHTLRGTSLRRRAQQRALVAGLVFVLGIGVLLAGAITNIIPLGVAGFVVMLASALVGLNALRNQNTAPAVRQQDAGPAGEPARGKRGLGVVDGGRAGRPSRGRSKPASSGGFMNRMEQRWRRRRDQQNGGF
ncbi:DUF3040 domain-containing protein [Nocardioides sp. BSK12Z-4]|uniref:DUF3040 domain-containing protein n=2 Tax=Nocardioides bruguierae TaxID=2945102 RepID=A0A9X2D944_9ACTN|nr:DUF3040 domain-containing protein [Nocardioides bruguierae]MCM0621628.1 DUF3040 domain-containing protein [Nocardioides bruguierae]